MDDRSFCGHYGSTSRGPTLHLALVAASATLAHC
jgi:hypothetical protein